MKKIRLDQLVFDKGLAESRERAKAYIMAGSVYVNGQKETKPGTSVAEDAAVEMRGETLPYVSRGGWKLEKALRVFPIDVKDAVCIDCGASTRRIHGPSAAKRRGQGLCRRCRLRSACLEPPH